MLTAQYPPFRPVTLCSDPHLQTIGAAYVRGKMSDYRAVKHLVRLNDDDRLVIHDDQPSTWITGDRIAIMIPGLCGSHASPYMRRTSDKLRRNGIRTIRVDLRGLGDSKFISHNHMYAGCTHDIESVIAKVLQLSPLSKLSLIGYSLGGAILLRLLGEWGNRFPRAVDSAISVSPPIDLLHSSWNLRQRGNRMYDHFFIRQLQEVLTTRRQRVADLVDNGLSPLPNRLLHFDDQFVAPIWGFRSAVDYYEQTSAGPLLDNVSIPTILVAAKDDPIVPFEQYQNWTMSRYVEMVATKQGGHLGFLGRTSDPDRHWLDWRVCHWVTAL